MTKLHHAIYIPGLGDHRSWGQPLVLKLWALQGIQIHFFPLGWAHEEPFEAKLNRLINAIDRLYRHEGPVSLIGVSAGASAVVNAYAARKEAIKKVVLISGKVQNPQTILPDVIIHNPAFGGSMAMLEQSLPDLTRVDRQKMLAVHPLADEMVPIEDAKLPDVREGIMPVSGHMQGIVYSLTLGAPAIIRFIKRP